MVVAPSRALTALKVTPIEVVTDAPAVYPAVLDELVPQTWHQARPGDLTGQPTVVQRTIECGNATAPSNPEPAD
jgi:hypothetical protein